MQRAILGSWDPDCFHNHSVEQVAGRFEKFTSSVGGFCMKYETN